MAMHKVVLEWHDLMEDPTDLPTRDDLCMVMIWDPNPTIKNEHCVFWIPTDCSAIYNTKTKIWKLIETDADFFEMKEIGIDTKPMKAVGWAYAINPYIPEPINQLCIEKFGEPIRTH